MEKDLLHKPDFHRKDGFLLIILAGGGNDEKWTFIEQVKRTANPVGTGSWERAL